MWNESLPRFTGSFEDYIILFMIYIRYGLYYSIVLLGILAMIIGMLSPILITYFGISSLKLKIKGKKKNKCKKKNNDEKFYLDRLERNLKKDKNKK